MAIICLGTRKSFFLLLVLLSQCGMLLAQRITVPASSVREWSGGIAGRRGANYTFEIVFTGYATPPVPDTLWIGQTPIRLTLADTNRKSTLPANTTVKVQKNGVRYLIVAGTAHNDYEDRLQGMDGEKSAAPKCPISYGGVALLSFTHKGKRQYYEIKQVKTTLEPVNYP